MGEHITNLDSLFAHYGFAIVQAVAPNGSLTSSERAKLENTITKSLGVLQENGVYAFFLYLNCRLKDLGAEHIKNQSLGLLRHSGISLLAQDRDVLGAIRKLTEDLDKLLLARQSLEQTLVYARYHAKSLKETS